MRLSVPIAGLVAGACLSLLGCDIAMHTELSQAADLMAKTRAVEGPNYGIYIPSELSAEFIRLVDSASTSELVELAHHDDPMVRFHALRAIGNRGDKDGLYCLVAHLADTTVVKFLWGDLVSSGSVCSYVADEFLREYCLKTPLTQLDYLQIRTLASNRLVPASLYALARFQRPSDVELLHGRIRETIFRDRIPHASWYGLSAIRAFPAPAFLPILRESVDSLLQGTPFETRALMQAIAQYDADSAYVLLDRLLQKAPSDDDARIGLQLDLVTALVRAQDYRLRRRLAGRLTLGNADLLFGGAMAFHEEEVCFRAP